MQGGELVTLVLLPAPEASTNPCDNFGPFALPAIPVFQGQATELGQVTWLNNAALGANGIGPCADGGSSVTDDGGMEDGGSSGPTGWVDAGVVGGLDGGEVAQTGVYPLTSDAGGIAVAWIEGPTGGQHDIYVDTMQGNLDVRNALTFGSGNYGGLVNPGSLSGAQFAGGVLLTFATSTSSDPSTVCAFVSPGPNPPVTSFPPFPSNTTLGAEQTTTFAGQLNGIQGAYVFEPAATGAGVVGVFTPDGTSYTGDASFALVPGGTTAPVTVTTLIGTTCDVADLNGMPGFCLAGGGMAQGNVVGFVASFTTNNTTPVLNNTSITEPIGLLPQNLYVGFTAVPHAVAVALGNYGGTVYYWQLSDLSVAAGAGTQIGVATDVLLNDNGNVLGLSLPGSGGTAFQFLPNGPEPMSLQYLLSGSDFPAAFVDSLNDDIVTAGVSTEGSDPYNGQISILRLAPDGG